MFNAFYLPIKKKTNKQFNKMNRFSFNVKFKKKITYLYHMTYLYHNFKSLDKGKVFLKHLKFYYDNNMFFL